MRFFEKENFCFLETTRTAFRVDNGFGLLNSHLIITENNDENLSESIFNLMIILSQDDGMKGNVCLFEFPWFFR
jgi:hypothetical protein